MSKEGSRVIIQITNVVVGVTGFALGLWWMGWKPMLVIFLLLCSNNISQTQS